VALPTLAVGNTKGIDDCTAVGKSIRDTNSVIAAWQAWSRW